MDGGEWVELFVREMMNAANVDDARARATRALNGLEKSISARSDAEVAQTFYKVGIYLFRQICLNILHASGTRLQKFGK